MIDYAISLLQGTFWPYMTFVAGLFSGELLLFMGIMTALAAPPFYEYFHAQRHRETKPSEAQLRHERRLFWRNLVLAPIIVGPPMYLLYHVGVFREGVNLPLWRHFAEGILVFVAFDAWFYWSHRILHGKRFFGRFHATHHISVNPNAYSTLNLDLMDLVIVFGFVPLWVGLMGLAFGAISLHALFVFAVVNNAYNAYLHSGVEVFPARVRCSWLGRRIIWSGHHDRHHTHNDGNYGFMFTWWDDFCGTTSRD